MNRVQEHLHEQARSCYKRKEYQKALKLFDRAIGRAASVQLLDNRAACYEKLDDLPAALKDAKKAIQLQREDPTGYLRAGKVLIKIEKQSVALEIYSHGLRTVKHVGQGYELLRKAHGELLLQLSPPKSVDPLTVLPRELAEVILDYLNFKQRINACLVSKQWAHFIRSAPHLWEHLDLSGARRKVTNKFISRAINVGRKKLIKATLTSLYDFDKALIALLKHCPLQSLTLLDTGLQSQNLVDAMQNAKFLKHLHFGVGTSIGPTALDQVTKICAPTLETLDCNVPHTLSAQLDGHCPALTTLVLRGTTYLQYSADGMELVTRVLPRFAPNLQSLTMLDKCIPIDANFSRDLDALTHLRHLKVRSVCHEIGPFHFPASLETLSLVLLQRQLSFWMYQGGLGSGVPTWRRLNSLTDLYVDIPHVRQITPFLGHPFEADTPAEPASQLRRLAIGPNVLELDEADFPLLISHPRLRNLEILEMHMSDSCSDANLELICANLRHLHTVNVSGTKIDGHGVRQLVEKCNVRHLIMHNCLRLARDAVDWARSQGVRVEASSGDTSGEGRKVRY